MKNLSRIVLIVVTPLLALVASADMWAEATPEEIAKRTPLVHQPPGPEYAAGARIFQGIPGLERAPRGRLWATWYGGGPGEGPENYIMLASSGDDGRSWSRVQLVIDPPGEGRAFDPCLWHDPSGRLWLFWSQAHHFIEGVGTWGMVTDQSDVAEPSWSQPRRLFDGVMMNKPIVLASGDWILPTAIWHRAGSCRVVRSTDEGQSFELIGTATVPEENDRNPDEPMIVERNDGSLLMWVRTGYGIGQSTSADGGTTWTDVAPTGIAHPNARFFLRRLESGNLLLVKHGSLDKRSGRSHLKAYVSNDDGKTWGGGLLLDERTGVSYPDGVQTPDGKIYLIYDYDRMGAKQIMMATFTEADAAAGKAATDDVRLRVLVNQATGRPPDSQTP